MELWDVRGLGDDNAHRRAMAEQMVFEADCIWVLAKIHVLAKAQQPSGMLRGHGSRRSAGQAARRQDYAATGWPGAPQDIERALPLVQQAHVARNHDATLRRRVHDMILDASESLVGLRDQKQVSVKDALMRRHRKQLGGQHAS